MFIFIPTAAVTKTKLPGLPYFAIIFYVELKPWICFRVKFPSGDYIEFLLCTNPVGLPFSIPDSSDLNFQISSKVLKSSCSSSTSILIYSFFYFILFPSSSHLLDSSKTYIAFSYLYYHWKIDLSDPPIDIKCGVDFMNLTLVTWVLCPMNY